MKSPAGFTFLLGKNQFSLCVRFPAKDVLGVVHAQQELVETTLHPSESCLIYLLS